MSKTEEIEVTKKDLSIAYDLIARLSEIIEERKYTVDDMKKCWDACLEFNKPAGLDSGINFKDFIKSLK